MQVHVIQSIIPPLEIITIKHTLKYTLPQFAMTQMIVR